MSLNVDFSEVSFQLGIHSIWHECYLY